jgi:hypothetical protein
MGCMLLMILKMIPVPGMANLWVKDCTYSTRGPCSALADGLHTLGAGPYWASPTSWWTSCGQQQLQWAWCLRMFACLGPLGQRLEELTSGGVPEPLCRPTKLYRNPATLDLRKLRTLIKQGKLVGCVFRFLPSDTANRSCFAARHVSHAFAVWRCWLWPWLSAQQERFLHHRPPASRALNPARQAEIRPPTTQWCSGF